MAPTHENQIAERSYQIWEPEGKPEGKHLQHWFQAIAELEVNSTPQKNALQGEAAGGGEEPERGSESAEAQARHRESLATVKAALCSATTVC